MPKFRTLHSYFKDRELSLQEEAYQSMKDAAQRHGKRFDVSYEDWVPIWNRLDEACKQKDRKIKLDQEEETSEGLNRCRIRKLI